MRGRYDNDNDEYGDGYARGEENWQGWERSPTEVIQLWFGSIPDDNASCKPPPQVEYFLGELCSNTVGELRSVMHIAGVALAATTNAFYGVNKKGGVGGGGIANNDNP